MALASTIAVSVAAQRLLLLGDPQQLPQVSQGIHPEPLDASALGFPKGETPFADLPAVLPLRTVPGLPAARLSTGAAIVSGAGYDAIDAEMVDMETYAVARACMAQGARFICGVDEVGRGPLAGPVTAAAGRWRCRWWRSR